MILTQTSHHILQAQVLSRLYVGDHFVIFLHLLEPFMWPSSVELPFAVRFLL